MLGEGRVFSSTAEAVMARDLGDLHLQAKIKIRLKDLPAVDNGRDGWTAPEDWEPGQPLIVETTLGRALFNDALPEDYRFVNFEVSKSDLSTIVNDLAERYPKVVVAADARRDEGGRLPLGDPRRASRSLSTTS